MSNSPLENILIHCEKVIEYELELEFQCDLRKILECLEVIYKVEEIKILREKEEEIKNE